MHHHEPRPTGPGSSGSPGAARLRAIACLLTLALGACPGILRAQGSVTNEDPVSALRQEIEQLRRDYERRLADLESRLAAIEGGEGAPAPAEPAPAEDDLAALRAAAQAAAAEAGAQAGASEAASEPGAPGPQVAEATYGRERNLSRLNPEISMTGAVLGVASDADREDLRVQEFELDVQSALDPFSSTKWTLSFNEEEGVDIEEGYILYPSLAGGLGLTAGKFRQSFGVLNRWHLHALPQTDYPLALQAYFGEEGLAQTGVSLEWLVPRGWADTNLLTVQVTDGSNDAFGGQDFQRLAVLGRLSNYWDLSPATYLELGVSGVAGETAEGGRSRVWGGDLTVDWTPPARAKYREVTWRTELLYSERDDPSGLRHDAWGGYSYLEGLLAQNLWAGVRYDRVEDPFDPDHRRQAVVPYVSWWQSEFVRLHGEYRWLDDDLTGESENAFALQLVWAAGPHKHEKY